jgi:hypothetical protein
MKRKSKRATVTGITEGSATSGNWASALEADLLPENSATRWVRIRLRMPAGRAPRCGGNGSPKSRSSGS